jgi:hypothetical protein
MIPEFILIMCAANQSTACNAALDQYFKETGVTKTIEMSAEKFQKENPKAVLPIAVIDMLARKQLVLRWSF